MKQILTFFIFSFVLIAVSGQPTIESVLPTADVAGNENKRIQILYEYFGSISESDPIFTLKQSQTLLSRSRETNDEVGEVLALSIIGYIYRGLGNTVESMTYNLQSLEKAQHLGNEKLIAIAEDMTATSYKDLGDYQKALPMFHHARVVSERLNFHALLQSVYGNMSDVYIKLGKLDSALSYAQKDYELCIKNNYFSFFSYTLINLGDIHAKLGKPELAMTYYNMAIEEANRINSPKMLNWAYTAKSEYFNELKRNDSAVYYAKKAVYSVENTAFANYSLKPAKQLMSFYEKQNSDSAVKYFKMYNAVLDSVYSTRIIQQTGLLSFENELRLQNLRAENKRSADQRKQNIQYALLAISVITFIVVSLLLSRRMITSEKVIRFLGVLALLIVFEFLNLLLHPFLERITGHRPAFMLLALVCIAALLVPLHHRLEKTIIKKLVEKNKQARLLAAKRTIEKLEKEP